MNAEVSATAYPHSTSLPSDSCLSHHTDPSGLTPRGQTLDFPTPPPVPFRRQADRDFDTQHAMIPLKPAHGQCQCLQTVGDLLEGLDGKSHATARATLDSILASQKEALGRCDSVLNCPTCVARPEYILFLELITENLTSLCELTVSKYLSEAQSRDRDALPGCRPHPDCGSPSSASCSKVFLGKYEIESPEEWSSLIRVLIGMQLRNLRTLLQRMTTASSPGPGPGPGATRRAKVQATEERVAQLVKQLWQPRSRATPMSIGSSG